MLAGETIAKDNYPSIIQLRNKEAQFDKVMKEYVSLYKQHLSGLGNLSSSTMTWKDSESSWSVNALDTSSLGKVSNFQACKNKIKEGDTYSSILFIGKEINPGWEEFGITPGSCFGFNSNKSPLTSSPEYKGFYVSTKEKGVKLSLKQNKAMVKRLGDLNDELHKLMDEIKVMVAKVYPKGIQNDKEAVKKFQELQSKASVLDDEREKIKNQQRVIDSIKGQLSERQQSLNYNKYLFAGFTIVGIGALAFAIRSIMKEKRTLQ
jgi:hypothetical protein